MQANNPQAICVADISAFTVIRKCQFRYDFFFSPIMFQPNKDKLFFF
jgi:hypothetical protein